NRSDWFLQNFSQRLKDGKTYPESGERTRPGDNRKCINVVLCQIVLQQQSRDLRHKLSRECPAFKRYDFESAFALAFKSNQRQTSIPSRGIDGEDQHDESLDSTRSSKTPPALEGWTKI